MKLIHVADVDTFNNVLDQAKDRLVVANFYAKWCGPCQKFKTFFEEVSEEYINVVFMTVDIDNAEELSELYKITSLPTLKFIKQGQEIKSIVGTDTERIIDIINNNS